MLHPRVIWEIRFSRGTDDEDGPRFRAELLRCESGLLTHADHGGYAAISFLLSGFKNIRRFSTVIRHVEGQFYVVETEHNDFGLNQRQGLEVARAISAALLRCRYEGWFFASGRIDPNVWMPSHLSKGMAGEVVEALRAGEGVHA